MNPNKVGASTPIRQSDAVRVARDTLTQLCVCGHWANLHGSGWCGQCQEGCQRFHAAALVVTAADAVTFDAFLLASLAEWHARTALVERDEDLRAYHQQAAATLRAVCEIR